MREDSDCGGVKHPEKAPATDLAAITTGFLDLWEAVEVASE